MNWVTREEWKEIHINRKQNNETNNITKDRTYRNKDRNIKNPDNNRKQKYLKREMNEQKITSLEGKQYWQTDLWPVKIKISK